MAERVRRGRPVARIAHRGRGRVRGGPGRRFGGGRRRGRRCGRTRRGGAWWGRWRWDRLRRGFRPGGRGLGGRGRARSRGWRGGRGRGRRRRRAGRGRRWRWGRSGCRASRGCRPGEAPGDRHRPCALGAGRRVGAGVGGRAAGRGPDEQPGQRGQRQQPCGEGGLGRFGSMHDEDHEACRAATRRRAPNLARTGDGGVRRFDRRGPVGSVTRTRVRVGVRGARVAERNL